MTGDLDVHDLRVSDLEEQVAILERKLDGALKNWAAVAKAHSDLADDFTKVEDVLTRVNGLSREIGTFGTSFETRLAAAENTLRILAEDWRRQHDVYKALKAMLPYMHHDVHYRNQWEALHSALREALWMPLREPPK